MTEPDPITLSGESARIVEDQLARGKYASADTVVEAALQLLEAREQADREELQRLRQMIQEGADDLDAGRVVDGETVMRESRERLLAKAAKLREAS